MAEALSKFDQNISSNFPRPWRKRSQWLELGGVAVILTVFILIHLAIAGRHATWGDEMLFADPAVHLAREGRFVSTVWPCLDETTFWSANAPIYSLLVAFLFSNFSISYLSADIINLSLVSVAIIALWWGCRRALYLRTATARLLFLMILLISAPIYYVSSNLRYDCVGLALGALAFLMTTVRSRPRRLAGLSVIGLLLPAANYQLPIFLCLLGCALWVARCGRRNVVELCGALLAGAAAGGIMLLGIYSAHDGALIGFMRSVAEQTAPTLGQKLKQWHTYFRYDAGTAIFLLFGGLLSLMPRAQRTKTLTKNWGVATVLIGTVVPFVIWILRWYAESSQWVTLIPVAMYMCSGMETCGWRTTATRTAVAISLFVVSIQGLPKSVLATLVEWRVRDTNRIASFVSKHISSTDVVLCSPTSYFSAIQSAMHIYGLNKKTIENSKSYGATVLIVDEYDPVVLPGDIGREWQIVAEGTLLAMSEPVRLGLLRLPKSNFRHRLSILRRRL
jgi:hypothetical protein